MKEIFVLLALALASCSHAQRKHSWAHDPAFLAKDTFKLATMVPPSPKRHSKVDDADFKEILRLQRTRTAADCERAASEVHITLETYFGPKYGPLSAAEVERWTPFFNEF